MSSRPIRLKCLAVVSRWLTCLNLARRTAGEGRRVSSTPAAVPALPFVPLPLGTTPDSWDRRSPRATGVCATRLPRPPHRQPRKAGASRLCRVRRADADVRVRLRRAEDAAAGLARAILVSAPSSSVGVAPCPRNLMSKPSVTVPRRCQAGTGAARSSPVAMR